MDDLANDEILSDWKGALDALFAHGLERAVPDGSNPRPLQFHGTGAYPLLRLLQLGGSAPAGAVSEKIFATVTEGLPAAYARQWWAEWTARAGLFGLSRVPPLRRRCGSSSSRATATGP
jgi:hypothetical protein